MSYVLSGNANIELLYISMDANRKKNASRYTDIVEVKTSQNKIPPKTAFK